MPPPPFPPADWKHKKEYKHKEYSHGYTYYKRPYHKNYKYVAIKGVYWYDYDYCGKKYFKCFDDHHYEVGMCWDTSRVHLCSAVKVAELGWLQWWQARHVGIVCMWHV